MSAADETCPVPSAVLLARLISPEQGMAELETATIAKQWRRKTECWRERATMREINYYNDYYCEEQ